MRPITTAVNPHAARTHNYLGTDEEGFVHHVDERQNRVLAIAPDGEIEATHTFEREQFDTHLTEYIDYVEELHGWTERKYTTQTEFFRDGIAAGVRRLGERSIATSKSGERV